jgi:hypothetical protein
LETIARKECTEKIQAGRGLSVQEGSIKGLVMGEGETVDALKSALALEEAKVGGEGEVVIWSQHLRIAH